MGRAWLETPEAPEELWRVVDVVREEGEESVVRDASGGESRVATARLGAYDASFEDEALCADVGALASLSAAPLVCALRRRFEAETTYTRVGPVLVAVNPLKPVRDDPAAPHVRDVALAATAGAVGRRRSQAIVISGESGAGKTVSATRIIEYLVESGGTGRSAKRESFERRELAKETLLARLAASIPALEALGNARTCLNDNSSRFGKLVKLSYDGRGALRDVAGASIDEFLLEKARAARRFAGAGDRNFHVLCQLAGGADGARAYAPDATVEDAARLAGTKQSFHDLGLAPDAFALVAAVGRAILCLGDDDVAGAALHLGVDAQLLARALRERTCAGAGAVDADCAVAYEPEERARVVDALAKALYAALFAAVVARANAALREPLAFLDAARKNPLGANAANAPAKEMAFVGILDIYGFEIFATNALDQLLINYANEVLQKSFDDCLLAAEAAAYAADGVPWASFDLDRALGSGAVVALVAAPPSGLLPLLDEQVKLGSRGCDAAFLAQADKRHRGDAAYGKPRFDRDKFVVHHYAGSVVYDPDGFLLSNSDPLPADVAAALATAADPAVASLLAREAGGGGGGGGSTLPQLRSSTSRVFRAQMKRLEATLAACESPARYVRCVRPNDAKSPLRFDASIVLN